MGLIKHEAQPHRIQSRGSHENKSRRYSQNSWEEHQTLELIRDKELELLNFKERVSVADNLVVHNWADSLCARQPS